MYTYIHIYIYIYTCILCTKHGLPCVFMVRQLHGHYLFDWARAAIRDMMCIYIYIYTYIYIYIERERERAVCAYIYIYIY